MGRIIALDFGMKRTGVAITDESNLIASPLTTVDSRELMPLLVSLVREKHVDTIVLGEPKRLDGSDTHISENVRLLKEALQKQFPAVNITMLDERFTSKIAGRAMVEMGMKKEKRKQKEMVDMISATLLLQDYLGQL